MFDTSRDNCVQVLHTCVLKARRWITSCKLKLNEDKSEIIILASLYYQTLLQDSIFKINSAVIIPKASVKNLVLYFNEKCLWPKNQMSSICKTVHYHP